MDCTVLERVEQPTREDIGTVSLVPPGVETPGGRNVFDFHASQLVP